MKLRYSGLAVALVSCVALTPLTTASTAFAAPVKAESSPSAKQGRYFDGLSNHFGRLVLLDTENNSYVGIDDGLHGERENTLDEAEADASFFDLPKTGEQSEISNLATGELVKVDAGLPGGVGYQDGSILDPGYLFDVSTDGEAKSDSSKEFLGFDDATGKLAMTSTARYRFVGSGTGQQPVSLVAGVDKDSIDASAGTALLTGTASSTAAEDDVQIKVGTASVTTDDHGAWAMFITGLRDGEKNELIVEQVVDGTPFDQRTVVIDLSDEEVTPTTPLAVTGPAENEKIVQANGRVDFSGTGEDGTTVTAVTKGGLTLGSGEVKNGQFAFSTWRKIAGDYEVTLTMAGGDLATSESTTVHYNLLLADEVAGPLVITGPTENEQIVQANGRVDFTGTGTDGTTVTAVTKGGLTLGSGTVTNGTFSFSTWRKIAGDYEVTLTMAGGDLATPDLTVVHYTLKLAADADKAFKVTGPTDGQTIVHANGRVDFSGEGKSGAKVKAVTKGGVELGSAEVRPDGSWTFPTWRSVTGAYEVTITQDGVTPVVVKYSLANK